MVGVKLKDDAIDWIDARALAEQLTIRGGEPNRSEMVRLMLAYASAKMPAGWRPTPPDQTSKE